MAQGQFADVYRGRLCGLEIAAKVIRVFQNSDMDRIMKVSSTLLIHQNYVHHLHRCLSLRL
jgi:hypothetical protein